MNNTISIELNQEELNAVVQLIDAGVKATGINGAKIAVLVMSKLENAIDKVNTQNGPIVRDDNKLETKLEVVE